jgi:hypothetical protein
MTNASLENWLRSSESPLGECLSCLFRGWLAAWFGLICTPLLADEAGVPATASRHRLQIRIVTDDDFLELSAPAWCAKSLTRSLSESKLIRNTSELGLVYLPAGAPEVLEDVRPKVGPRRAICFFCDSDNRIFGLCIGVPRGKELVRLLEDAEELMIVASLADRKDSAEPGDGAEEKNEEDDEEEIQGDDDVIRLLRERTASRTIRHYRPLLNKITHDSSITDAAKLLVPAVQLDLAERFQLQTPIDSARLVSTQQHVESSRYWCDAMLPCLIGESFDDVWPELTEVIWSARPWQVIGDAESLTNWFESQIESKPIVLELELTKVPFLSVPFADGMDKSAAEKQKQEKLQSLQAGISQASFEANVAHRVVNYAELACLLKHQAQYREVRSSKVFHESDDLPQWLVFESKAATPLALSAKSHNRLKDLIERWTGQP